MTCDTSVFAWIGLSKQNGARSEKFGNELICFRVRVWESFLQAWIESSQERRHKYTTFVHCFRFSVLSLSYSCSDETFNNSIFPITVRIFSLISNIPNFHPLNYCPRLNRIAKDVWSACVCEKLHHYILRKVFFFLKILNVTLYMPQCIISSYYTLATWKSYDIEDKEF